MEFERKILIEVKQDYENFIEKHQKIYKDTITYFRYLEHQGKIKKKLSYIEEQVSIYNGIETNYKNILYNVTPNII
jgi:hypothetical protein